MDGVEDDGGGDPFVPGVRPASLVVPEGEGEEGADDERVEFGVVDGAGAELAGGADESPAKRERIR